MSFGAHLPIYQGQATQRHAFQRTASEEVTGIETKENGDGFLGNIVLFQDVDGWLDGWLVGWFFLVGWLVGWEKLTFFKT